MLRRGPVLAWCRAHVRARVAMAAAWCVRAGSACGTTTARVRAKRARAACARAPSATRPQRGVATAWRGKGGTGLVGSVLAAAAARPRHTSGGTRCRAKPKPGPWVRVHERDARCAWHGHNEADGHSG